MTLVLGAGITVRVQAGIIGVAAYPWNSPANVGVDQRGNYLGGCERRDNCDQCATVQQSGTGHESSGTLLYFGGNAWELSGGLGNIQSGNGPLVLSGVLTNVGQQIRWC